MHNFKFHKVKKKISYFKKGTKVDCEKQLDFMTKIVSCEPPSKPPKAQNSAVIDSKEREIDGYRTLIGERDQMIKSLKADLHDKNNKIEELEAKLHDIKQAVGKFIFK